MHRREFLVAGAAAAGAAVLGAEPARETLYNGIELPAAWPPKIKAIPTDPVTPPYLKSPPAVIPIDVGRQLFVDDFLIAETTLKRTFHTPKEHPDNPLVKPDTAWEKKGKGGMAMVFSDGVWYDPKDRLYKMWYLAGGGSGTCYATSEDGLKWTKPELDVRKGTNIVQPDPRDSGTVWLDLEEKDPKRRYKSSARTARATASAFPSTSPRTAFTGASACCAPDRAAIAPRSSAIRSARCGSTVCATVGASRAAPLLGGQGHPQGTAVAAH